MRVAAAVARRGRTNGRTDIRMSEWTDKQASEPTAHDLFIFKCVLFTIARTKARTRSRISVWSLQRGVKARRASPLICSLYARIDDCSFCIRGAFLGFAQRQVSHLSAFLLTSDTIQMCRKTSLRILIRVKCHTAHFVCVPVMRILN